MKTNSRTGEFELHLNPDIKVLSHCAVVTKLLARYDIDDERGQLAKTIHEGLVKLNAAHGIKGDEHLTKDIKAELAAKNKPAKSLIPEDDALVKK